MATQLAIRDVTLEDTDAILDLVTEVDLAELGEPDHTVIDVRPRIGVDFRGWVVEDDAGIAGYCWAHRRPDHSSVEADVTVRPGRHELYLPLLDLVRPAARELDARLPLQITAAAQMGPKRRVLEAVGGRIVRRFLRMAVELPAEPVPRVPEPPPGVVIRTLTDADSDLRAMHGVVDSAFRDHFGYAGSEYDEWRDRITAGGLTDRSLWWLADVDGVPAAGLMATMSRTGGYVDTLGTLREYRGSGLGRALLLTSFAEFHARGCRKVMLGVDADNHTGAVELYQSLGMSAVVEGLLYELA
ncbi:MAG TPA: GNAT family N-acetyltransferase [Mycobacteriales bacterium]|jgi:ribosomal protein S18 acetylase RimI-like enzyme|nr:GNAT family N-acetyltransferase [Mycobacteriales bacterium]